MFTRIRHCFIGGVDLRICRRKEEDSLKERGSIDRRTVRAGREISNDFKMLLTTKVDLVLQKTTRSSVQLPFTLVGVQLTLNVDVLIRA